MGSTRNALVGSFVALPLLIGGLALPGLADAWRPFKGSATEVVTGATPEVDGLLVTTTGSGQATHLGKFTRVATVLIHNDGSLEGEVVFTAANGDQLNATLEGARVSPTKIVGTYTFVRGTGRFDDAVGEADFEGLTPDGVHVALRFDGTVAY